MSQGLLGSGGSRKERNPDGVEAERERRLRLRLED